jgi:hypothetical protein
VDEFVDMFERFLSRTYPRIRIFLVEGIILRARTIFRVKT